MSQDPVDDDPPSLADHRDTSTVYPAAEDSGLLAEAAIDALSGDELVIDIGTGSGYVGHRIAVETGARVVGSDINPAACREAKADLPVVLGHLLEPFCSDVADVVVFNPPYLPTQPTTGWHDGMERALCGGPTGRAVIEPFLSMLPRVLASGGEAYLVVSSLTDIAAVSDHAEDCGLAATEVATESHFFERLVVLRLRPMSRER